MNQEKVYCKPNIELVKKYINEKNPTMYSFRLENPKLKDNEIGIVNFKKYRKSTCHDVTSPLYTKVINKWNT